MFTKSLDYRNPLSDNFIRNPLDHIYVFEILMNAQSLSSCGMQIVVTPYLEPLRCTLAVYEIQEHGFQRDWICGEENTVRNPVLCRKRSPSLSKTIIASCKLADKSITDHEASFITNMSAQVYIDDRRLQLFPVQHDWV